MKNYTILLLTFLIFPIINYAQDSYDYVVLMPENHLAKKDTIYGSIKIPKTGHVRSLTIKKFNGKKKEYYPSEVMYFHAGERYFASVPYLEVRTFAEIIMNGKIELCYYSPSLFHSGVGIDGNILLLITKDSHSHYFIKTDNILDYIMVPHSSKKIKDTIAFIFKDNKECYNKLMSEDFSEIDIPDLVKEYNGFN